MEQYISNIKTSLNIPLGMNSLKVNDDVLQPKGAL